MMAVVVWRICRNACQIRARVFAVLLCILCLDSVSAQEQYTAGHDTTNVVMLGDSNTWLGGDSCDRPHGWTKWFAEECYPATCRSYARSGATWTATVRTVRDVDEYTEKLGDNNVIYNQICRLMVAVADGRQAYPHTIIISAGTNDAWFVAARPGALDMDASEVFANDAVGHAADDSVNGEVDTSGSMLTLAGAVRFCCGLLQKTFPDVRIVLLTPLQSTAVSEAGITRAGDIIEECGRCMGLTVIRQDRLGCVARRNEIHRRCMTTDGTHTSVEGARFNGILIAKMLNIK